MGEIFILWEFMLLTIEYSNILNEIEKNDQIIIKYSANNNKPEKYMKQFYLHCYQNLRVFSQ